MGSNDTSFCAGRSCVTGQLPLFVDGEVKPIDLSDLDISPSNVRKQNVTADLDSLATTSLDEFWPPSADSRTMRMMAVITIIVGQRRYLASRQLGWERIPAFVLNRPFDR